MSLAVETEFAKSVRAVPRRALPVIDVGKARMGDAAAIEEVAVQWREVWESLGFLCIVNRGLEPELIDGMRDAAKQFHDLELETKLEIKVTHDQKGYVPARGGLTTHSKFHNSKKLNTVECLVLATDFPGKDALLQAYLDNGIERGRALLADWLARQQQRGLLREGDSACMARLILAMAVAEPLRERVIGVVAEDAPVEMHLRECVALLAPVLQGP